MWRLVALAGAVLLPVSLFLDWYAVEAGAIAPTGLTLEGWDAFESTDAVLVLASVATLAVLATAPPRAGAALLGAGTVAAAFVVVALADKPTPFGQSIPGLSVEGGAWLALAGAVLVVVGGALRAAARRGL